MAKQITDNIILSNIFQAFLSDLKKNNNFNIYFTDRPIQFGEQTYFCQWTRLSNGQYSQQIFYYWELLADAAEHVIKNHSVSSENKFVSGFNFHGIVYTIEFSTINVSEEGTTVYITCFYPEQI